MACCEKCWEDVYSMAKYSVGSTQTECYYKILKLKHERGETCTPKEQAGQFWDEDKRCDNRLNS